MLKIGKVHGCTQIIKVIEGKPHIPEKNGKKLKWIETMIVPSRLKQFRPLHEVEACLKIMELERELRIKGK